MPSRQVKKSKKLFHFFPRKLLANYKRAQFNKAESLLSWIMIARPDSQAEVDTRSAPI